MKILAIKPRPAKQTIRMDRVICTEPLELEYLSAVLYSHEILLLDGMVDRTDPLKKAKDFAPDIVLITSFITNVEDVLKLAYDLKNKLSKIPFIAIGGPHAEVVPNHFFTKTVDAVFQHDQLVGIRLLVEALQSNQKFTHIPGTCFRTENGFIVNQGPSLDPVKLPRPDRKLLIQKPDLYSYMYFKPCASVKTAFGCPHRCTFCFCTEMHQGSYGPRPIEDVVDEIAEIPVENIFLLDDTFLVNPDRLNKFCQELENKDIKKRYIAYGTSKFVVQHQDLLARLARNGLSGLIIGFEFVGDQDLENYHKSSTVKDNNEALKICNELDIEVFALFMVDPDWSWAELKGLAAYIKKSGITFATFSTLTIFPGTVLEKQIKPLVSEYWRYDLLRLHQKPARLSKISYYLWLFYLYLLPSLRIASLKVLIRRYGLWGTLKLTFTSAFVGLEYLVKLIIWP